MMGVMILSPLLCLQEATTTGSQHRLRVETLEAELSRAVSECQLSVGREETLRQRLAEREEVWKLQVCGGRH